MRAGGVLGGCVGLLGSAALSPEGFKESVVLVALLVALVRGWYTVLREGVGCMLSMRCGGWMSSRGGVGFSRGGRRVEGGLRVRRRRPVGGVGEVKARA